eukprot:CAMPEP_0197677032 /NCGR_PEP_ID=MMETSP1338-20131121/87761_1 /TAXON_ID=43686 ORGANISM="Pelagodinium beii, Strain RCC1491" /NCGR_SAMPLE_ID=MMETSP1338 /ASSEMBLY_ACC=CAM_ASM_000754 /LENGTH=114 /DNA_ID=CAMNT_0043257811 /DNA_START=246 /DNA_END=587 /DNA_ORIENTATION=+
MPGFIKAFARRPPVLMQSCCAVTWMMVTQSAAKYLGMLPCFTKDFLARTLHPHPKAAIPSGKQSPATVSPMNAAENTSKNARTVEPKKLIWQVPLISPQMSTSFFVIPSRPDFM